MCSLHLTHPSALGAVGSQLCSARGEQSRGSSHGFPAGAGIQTYNLGLPQVSSPTLYPLGHDCPDGGNETLCRDDIGDLLGSPNHL